MTRADQVDVPRMQCEACGAEVPVGAFCGSCGAQRGDGRAWLRIGAYAGAPREQALRLSVASSLFPHLPHRSRTPFRVGLAVLFLVLIGGALLQWQAPLIAISALGFPLLFVLYLREADVHRDLPIRSLVLTAGLGAGLGVGWALLTGTIVAESYDVPLGAGESHWHALLQGLAISTAAAALMLLPAMAARLLPAPSRESLDGFVIGALGAIGFTAAATLTRLAPQIATGPTAPERPAGGLLVQAGIQGVAMPLTAAAMGGLVGAALWFSPATDSGRHRRSRVIAVVASVLVALAVYAIVGLFDIAPLLQGWHFGLHILVAVFALLIVRIGLQAALLNEAQDEMSAGEYLLCPHCEHVVSDMAFCPNCGVAARAASRTSRAERRLSRPHRQDASAPVHGSRPGYAVPPGWYAVVPARHTNHLGLLTTLGAGLAVAAAAAATAAIVVTPAPARYTCPPDCGRPPIGQPIETNPRFTSTDGEFSVNYPGPGTAYEATLERDGVLLNFTAGDTGTMQLFGQPAANRTPKQIAEDLVHASYPDATTDYEIPNAMVGYELGYGVVADEYPQDSSGTYTRLRLVVMVAVKNDYALIAAAIGPYHEYSPDFGSGHPSGVNLQLALDMGKYVNSFRWRSDPAR